jgi:hypothetical protein
MREFHPSTGASSRLQSAFRVLEWKNNFLQCKCTGASGLAGTEARPGAPSRLPTGSEPPVAVEGAQTGPCASATRGPERFALKSQPVPLLLRIFFSPSKPQSADLFLDSLIPSISQPLISRAWSSPLHSLLSVNPKVAKMANKEDMKVLGMPVCKFPRSVNKRSPSTSPLCATPSPWSIGAMARTLQHYLFSRDWGCQCSCELGVGDGRKPFLLPSMG